MLQCPWVGKKCLCFVLVLQHFDMKGTIYFHDQNQNQQDGMPAHTANLKSTRTG